MLHASPPSAIACEANALVADPLLYGPIGVTRDSRTRVEERELAPGDATAVEVPRGHVLRVSLLDGPQSLDINLWNLRDLRERFWAARTRQFDGVRPTVGDRLWSVLPFLRPLATIVSDSACHGLAVDEAAGHDLLGTCCDPFVAAARSAPSGFCHAKLARAVRAWGLTELDVHDPIGLFRLSALDSEGGCLARVSPSRPGAHVELFAEIDLLVATSACVCTEVPGGRVGLEVLSVSAHLLHGWTPPRIAAHPRAGGSV